MGSKSLSLLSYAILSCSVVSNFLRPHGLLPTRLLCPWGFSRQDYLRVAMSSSRGFSQPKDWTQISLIAGGFFTSWATRESQEFWSGWLIPSPGDLSNPGIRPGSPALQADSLPAELPEKPPSASLICYPVGLCLFLTSSVLKLPCFQGDFLHFHAELMALRYAPWTGCISSTLELIRNASSCAPLEVLKQKLWEWVPKTCISKPTRWFWGTLQFENHCSKFLVFKMEPMMHHWHHLGAC